MRWVRRIVFALAVLIAVALTVWAAAAVYFDSPLGFLRTPAAVLYLLLVLAALIFLRRSYKGVLVAFAGWWTLHRE